MAQLDVEKEKDGGNKWWIWLLVAIAAIVILWVVFDNSNDDSIDDVDDMNDNTVTETTTFTNEAFQISNGALAPASKDVYNV